MADYGRKTNREVFEEFMKKHSRENPDKESPNPLASDRPSYDRNDPIWEDLHREWRSGAWTNPPETTVDTTYILPNTVSMYMAQSEPWIGIKPVPEPSIEELTAYWRDYIGTTTITTIPQMRTKSEIEDLKNSLADYLLDAGDYPELLEEILPDDCFEEPSDLDSDTLFTLPEKAIFSLLNWILLRK